MESRARATKEIFGVASGASGWRTGGRDALSRVTSVDVRPWAGHEFPRREAPGDMWWMGNETRAFQEFFRGDRARDG